MARSSTRARMARRIVEVLDFFDDAHPDATVQDIVGRYGWPQSSTSELLAALVELGVLHRDAHVRRYRPAARAALLGAASQPAIVRDGGLLRLVDRLALQTGLAVGLFGMVGVRCQIVAWRRPQGGSQAGGGAAPAGLHAGAMTPLSACAAGWLLLSSIEPSRREGMIRRLRAEADEAQRISCRDVPERVAVCGAQGHAHGPAGFGADASMLGMLLPPIGPRPPLVAGFVFAGAEQLQLRALLQCLREAIDQCCRDGARAMPASALPAAA